MDSLYLIALLVLTSSALSSNIFIKETNLGRRFDGIGGLSGGGATSKLLVSYKEPYRSQILDYLFKPNFGASLHLLKVEIGGDAQSTEGTEASHMHNPWDLNFNRGYEWWLMKEARKRNPDILLYGLPWAFPGWVANGTNYPFKHPEVTAGYILNWVIGCERVHKLKLNYLGIWNERPWTGGYVMLLRSMLDADGFSHVRLVVADGDWSPVAKVTTDPKFAKALDYIGVHYPGTLSSAEAKKCGKQLWSSEDFSTKNDDVGAGCWARLLNQNYVNGLMTSTISWNLIAAYYDALPYTRSGLMTANEPWSGAYDAAGAGPLWVSAHTTQFTAPGWRYAPHGGGVQHLPHGGSIVTLMSAAKPAHLTMVIEIMSHNHSLCIRPTLPPYTVTPQNITISLPPTFANLTQMSVWKSQLRFGKGQNSDYFVKQAPIKIVGGHFSISLGVDEVVTISTVGSAVHGRFPKPPPQQPFPLPYADNFDAYDDSTEPSLIAPQVASMEVVSRPRSFQLRFKPNKCLQQSVLKVPVDWCDLKPRSVKPLALLGNFKWQSISVALDVMIPSVNATSGVFVAARIDRGGCNVFAAQGLFFWLFAPSSASTSPHKRTQHQGGSGGGQMTAAVTADLARTKQLWAGPLLQDDEPVPGSGSGGQDPAGRWFHVELAVAAGSLRASVDGRPVVRLAHLPATVATHGFVGFGADSFGLAYYDNLRVWRQK